MRTSTTWSLQVESEEISECFSSSQEVLWTASRIEAGELYGSGEDGDEFQLQFDAQHAFLLYMKPDQKQLRPRFSKGTSGDGIEQFFCHCCGIQLGDRTALMAECMSRERGFSLLNDILCGTLRESDEVQWVPLVGTREEF